MTDNIFNGKIIKAYRKNVTLPNNNKTQVDMVEHSGGACVLAIDNNNKVILIKQYRATIDKYIWEIPAGKIDNNEDPLECSKRELEEEAGYTANKWEKLINFYSSPGFCNEILYIYRATDLKRVEAKPEQDEIIEIYTFSKEEIKKMFLKNEFIDAKTIIALQYFLSIH